ncbi:olfactory receptor 4P4-like [Oryctolagus cuniculus]|uniref:olfactory receptor 4P4-like n=1 Tax=Oryctolagus cuniculus TaxID=9986 RepID=UPI0038796686
MEYRTNITDFILLGLSQTKEVEILCFLVFLLCYIAILIGNLLIMISITCSPLINQPMYFFLSYLSLSDLCYTSTVTPKLIMDLLATKKTISYNGCMTQLFAMHFFGGVEVFILMGMAYDRYVAICKPLHYTIIMNRQRCDAMIAASCAGGFLHSFGQFLLAIFLPYCGPNKIDHYFCDVYPLLKLACMDTSRIGFLVIANSGVMGVVTFVVLLISYAVILHTVRSYSMENRRKALSTCSSHIIVVVLFFAPLLFIYIRPATTFPEDKVFALFYTIIAPMLNPLIYTLRNVEMKNAIKKLCRATEAEEKWGLKKECQLMMEMKTVQQVHSFIIFTLMCYGVIVIIAKTEQWSMQRWLLVGRALYGP